MTTPSHSTTYTLRRVQELLGISRTAVMQFVSAGFVSPKRGARNEHRFTFQDLMLLRTAHELQRAKIPPRKILRALQRLKATLPEEAPLTGLRITASGSEVSVRDRQGQWEPDSGQFVIDFEVVAVKGAIGFLDVREAPVEVDQDDPTQWFARGEELEGTDPPAAEAAYRTALRLAPDCVAAYLNLGAMLCEAKRCDDAVDLYEQALRHCADSALLHFNYAIALEDQGQIEESLTSYERSLQLDPTLADAHFNIGRLQEKRGDTRGALRHFSAYRRLQT